MNLNIILKKNQTLQTKDLHMIRLCWDIINGFGEEVSVPITTGKYALGNETGRLEIFSGLNQYEPIVEVTIPRQETSEEERKNIVSKAVETGQEKQQEIFDRSKRSDEEYHRVALSNNAHLF